MKDILVIEAFAKLNLILSVLGKRDDGYHEIDTVMQQIELADEIVLTRLEKGTEIFSSLAELENKDNLAYKAAMILQREHPEIGGVRIEIDKKIPLEAGLAGGSTDAAAVLLGLPLLYGFEPEPNRVDAYAAELGSDVAFCLHGPLARACGRGEVLTALPDLPSLYYVLVKPDFGLTSGAVYNNLYLNTRKNIDNPPDVEKYLKYIYAADSEALINEQANSLETSAFDLRPELYPIKKKMEELGAKKVLLSGSGPTLFASFSNYNEAFKYHKTISEHFAETYLVSGVSSSRSKERVKYR